MATAAGGYGASVPDPTDTTPADATSTGFGSFDELSQFGVPPALAQLQVRWGGTRDIAKVPSAGFATPMIPGRAEPVTHTYQKAVESLYKQTPDQIGDLQLQLVAGGFMGKNPTFVEKAPDKKTRDTWDEILKIAMRSDKTPFEVIQGGIDANGGLEEGLKRHAPGGTTAQKPDIPLTHPDDIRMVAKAASQKVLGKGWDKAKLDAFVQTYQAMEKGEGAAKQGSGAVVTNAPSMEASAEAEARRSNPVAAGATDWDHAASMMMDAFKTLGGGG